MSTTTQIDYDELNDAAKLLFDAAHGKGYRQGREQEIAEHAKWQARQNLDLASRMISAAIGGQRPNDYATRELTLFAQMLLSRSPEIYVRIPLDLLRQGCRWIHDSSKPVDLGALEAVQEAISAQLDALGGYPL